MQYAAFAKKNGLPEELRSMKSPEEYCGYLNHQLDSPTEDQPGLRIVTLSEDLFSEYMKYSDESKKRFVLGLMTGAIAAQEDGKLFTIERDESGTSTLLVTYVLVSNEHVVHVEKR